MKIAFIWQGFSGRYGVWRDGLWAAMKLIEKEHEVQYFDVDQLDKLREFNPDVALYWEAPCTLLGKDKENYINVMELPYKKALLFAGGLVRPDICLGFDLYFVESKLSEMEFEDLGLPWKRAFGVNTDIMKPQYRYPIYKGIIHATFAGWKRQQLFADALGKEGVACGRFQEHDRYGFDECLRQGVHVLPEQSPDRTADLINRSKCVVNTSDFWGGGQRCTLEGMACGKPVIVMNDSPKNMEFVEESGAGIICAPTKNDIKRSIDLLDAEMAAKATQYVLSKWTPKHYAWAIMDGIGNL